MSALDYNVKDISLADFGRKELAIAETEMPDLLACREEFGTTPPPHHVSLSLPSRALP